MKLTIDNLDGLGAVDYSGAVDATGRLRMERSLNAPSLCRGVLCLTGTGLATPVRRGRVVVTADAGTVLFTGYLATEPVPVYAGAGSAGTVYRLAFAAVSDEWLLDRQAGLPIATPSLGLQGGLVLGGLVTKTGTTGIAATGGSAGRAVGVFEPEPAAVWSANAGTAAAAVYGAYRVVSGALGLTPVGAVTHSFSDGDGTLSVGGLRTSSLKELANDVTVSGEMEPWAYVTEVFEGDGTTSVFELSEEPFRPGARLRELVNDSFDGAGFDARIWTGADPGSHLSVTSAGLTVSGGNGSDGQTTLTLADALELGGSLLVEAGSATFAGASDGVVCGVYGGSVSRANCFAGWNVRQAGGATVVVPYVNGAEVGTAYTLVSGHKYTLRLRLHCVEMQRVLQSYYATEWGAGGGAGAVTQFGGGLVSSPVQVVFDLVDLGVASNTPATVLYDGVVANALASGTFAAVDSVGLVGSIGSIRVTQTGSAWVVSTVPGAAAGTRLMGKAGEGVDCAVSYGATPKVTFFAGRVPVAGELVTVTHRGRRRAVARLEDAASVAAEVAGGAAGTARWLGRVLEPKARCTADCEAAAAAVLGFAANRAAAVAGSYVTVNPLAAGTDIWPGDLLSFGQVDGTTNGIVRRVTVEDMGARPEAMTYTMAFANDWAEGLGVRLSEAIAPDAVLPEVALTAAGQVLGNLQGMSVVSVTATTLTLDAGVPPPSGGGFEVRRRDDDFGPGVDQDLVLRSPVRGFAIPRAAVGEAFYVRMYDGSTVPLYSRCSSVVVALVAVV